MLLQLYDIYMCIYIEYVSGIARAPLVKGLLQHPSLPPVLQIVAVEARLDEEWNSTNGSFV